MSHISHVYFLRARSLVKIGFSTDIPNRMKAIGVRVSLISSVVGDRQIEQWLHRVLAAHRVKGEWFRPHPEVMHIIKHANRIVGARVEAMNCGIRSGATGQQMKRLRSELSRVRRSVSTPTAEAA